MCRVVIQSKKLVQSSLCIRPHFVAVNRDFAVNCCGNYHVYSCWVRVDPNPERAHPVIIGVYNRGRSWLLMLKSVRSMRFFAMSSYGESCGEFDLTLSIRRLSWGRGPACPEFAARNVAQYIFSCKKCAVRRKEVIEKNQMVHEILAHFEGCRTFFLPIAEIERGSQLVFWRSKSTTEVSEDGRDFAVTHPEKNGS